MRLVALAVVVVTALGGSARAEVPSLTPPKGITRQIGIMPDGVTRLVPNGATLVRWSKRTGLDLIDLTTGHGVANRADLASSKSDREPRIVLSPDGLRLALYRGDQRVEVLAVPSGKTLFTFAWRQEPDLQFLADGRLAQLDDEEIRFYDDRGTATLIAKTGHAVPKLLSPDGTQLVVEDNDGTERVIETKSGALLYRVPAKAWVAALLADGWVGGDGQGRVVTGKKGGATHVLVGKHDGELAVPPPYDAVYASTDKGIVGVSLAGATVFVAASTKVSSQLEVVRAGKTVALLADHCVMRFDLSGELLAGPQLCTDGQLIGIGDDGAVVVEASRGRLTFGRTGELTRADHPTRAVVDLGTAARLASDPALAARIAKLPLDANEPIQISDDGHWLFGLDRDNRTAVVDLASSKVRGGFGENQFVASRDGARFAVRGASVASTAIYNTRDGKLIRELPVSASGMALSGNGNVFAGDASEDPENNEFAKKLATKVIDVATGKVLFVADCQAPAALSRDGHRLACVGAFGSLVRVYDIPRKAKIAQFEPPFVDWIEPQLAFSSDGTKLAVSKGTISVVELPR